MGRFKDLTGQKIGDLTVIKRVSDVGEYVKWECLCKCGNICVVDSRSIGRTTKSCGCRRHEGRHNLSGTRLYNIWSNMKQRCLNPNNKFYGNYGGRGITIYSEWADDFVNFYKWAIDNGYDEALEIDRIDNNKGYFPDNCQWITHQEQQFNKRTNRTVKYNGETKPLKIWAEELGLDYHKINLRLLNGWSVEDAFESNGTEHFKKHYNNKSHMKPVIQYDLDMTLIGRYKSMGDAAQSVNGNPSGVYRCCHYKQSQYKGFIWRFDNSLEEAQG